MEPPAELFDKIMQRIDKERRFVSLRRRIAFFFVLLLGSGGAFIPAFRMAHTGIIESGFMQFFSLLFSDSGLAAAFWQNFLLAMFEALPATSIALFLATLFVFLESLKIITRDIKSLAYGFQ